MSNTEPNKQKITKEDLYKGIQIFCPQCNNRKLLKVPVKIINQSNHITTISIPTGLICEHHFQAFVDKNFNVRGYQLVDFEFLKIEYYESSELEGEREYDKDIGKFTSLPLFNEILNLLRDSVDDKEILGCAIFTTRGKVIYSSIPHSTLLDTIKEFEVRKEKKLHGIIKMLLELKNHEKICSEYLEIHNREFILVLLFSHIVNFAIGNMFLRNIVKKIIQLT